MPSVDDVLTGRHAMLERAAATFEADLKRVLLHLFRVTQVLAAEFDHAGGRFRTSSANLRLLRTMYASLGAALNEAGYVDAYLGYLGSYENLVGLVHQTFEVQELPAAFSTLNRQIATAARELDLVMFRAIGDTAMREVQRSITQAVLFERDYTSFVEDLRGVIVGTDARGSMLASRANTFAGTAIGQFDALMTERLGEEAGIKKWRYWGPLDRITRPWCRKALQANKPRTSKQIEALPKSPTNTTGMTNFVGRGGWNCRHMWVAVPEDEV